MALTESPQQTPQVTPEATAPPPAQSSPTSTPQPTPQPTSQPAPQRSPTAALPRREHTVAAGDTLFDIARRYGTTVDALVSANNLPNRNATLRVGQRLLIPG